MKATGIVRRIDTLGRLIVPKEIRRTMKIEDNDPFEIFIEKDKIVFRKYAPTVPECDIPEEDRNLLKENIKRIKEGEQK